MVLHNLSIVIPTLGGIELQNTIESINHSSHQPMEIILSFPRSSKKDCLEFPVQKNIKVIYFSEKGQVHQRIAGFNATKTRYVIHMDSDMRVNESTIFNLYNLITMMPENVAIAPILRDFATDLDIFTYNNLYFNEYSKFVTPHTRSRKFFNYFIHGKTSFLEGEITNIGINIPVCSSHDQTLIEAEWLPGGLVIHNKKNLLTNLYFPFPGKAYAEDLIHSYILKKNGVKLYVTPVASAYIEIFPGSSINTFTELKSFLIEKKREIDAKAYFLKISKRNSTTFSLFAHILLFWNLLLLSFKKILKLSNYDFKKN